MTRAAGARKRQQGSIDQLPSGALRVRIQAGVDPVTKRRHDLIEIIPAGPDAQWRAEDARLRLLAELRERRNPRTNATVDQLLDRYLALHSGGKTTLSDYQMAADKHVRPFIDQVKIGALEADVVERIGALYGAHTAITAAEPGSSAYRWATAQFSAALGGQHHRPHRLTGRQQDQTRDPHRARPLPPAHPSHHRGSPPDTGLATHYGKTSQPLTHGNPEYLQLFKRLKAARIDNSVEAEMRRLAHVQLLILDDFALQPLDATETTDFYELIVERHRKTATVLTSNRKPSEWLAMMADPLLAQSAVDRLVSTAHELVIEGDSYRRRQKPSNHTKTNANTGVSVDQQNGDHHAH